MGEFPDVVLTLASFEVAGWGKEGCIRLEGFLACKTVRLGEELEFLIGFMNETRLSRSPCMGVLLVMFWKIVIYFISQSYKKNRNGGSRSGN